MGRGLLIVVWLAGCGHSGDPADAPTDPLVCKANLEASFDRTCTVATQCALVNSQDCCGTVVLAIASAPANVSAFAAAENTYGSCLACGARGCAHADYAESGGAPMAGQAIVATCDTGHCKAIVQ